MAALPYIAMVVSALGAVQQSQAAATASKVNAQISEKNSQITNAQGAAAAEAQGRDTERRLGAMVAAYGASGADPGSGSPMDVLADSARNAALDNLTLRYNYKMRAAGYEDQATLDRFNASASQKAGYMSAAGALLGGYSKTKTSQFGGV